MFAAVSGFVGARKTVADCGLLIWIGWAVDEIVLLLTAGAVHVH
jgi:hypothetical protein